MRRFLGNIVGKALTGKSFDDRNQENFMNFCLANHLTNTDVKKYRIDRDPMDPSFWNQTYIGTCVRDKKRYGLVVTIDENTGYTDGELFLAEHSSKRDEAVHNYKRPDHHYRSLQGYVVGMICDSKSTQLDDSNKYRFRD
jgi:hypothetical protein